MIFDLSAIPAAQLLSGLRIWPRSGSNNYTEWFRHRGMKVSLSYDEDAITPSGETLVAGREVYQIGDDSAVTGWQMIPDFIAGAVVPIARVEEMPITLPKSQSRPHYLRIEGISLGNLNELELRTVSRGGLVFLVR